MTDSPEPVGPWVSAWLPRVGWEGVEGVGGGLRAGR